MSHNFQKLEVYQRSLLVGVKIMAVMDEVKPYRLAEEIASSSISIPSNIAEGAERGSKKEFIRFLGYASGSAAEFNYTINHYRIVWKKINLDLPSLITELKEINAMLGALINKHKAPCI